MAKTEVATIEQETNELAPISGNQLLKSDTGLIPANMGQVVELAQLMAKAGPAVPPAFRANPGLCAAVIFQALHWRANPFSLASLAYVVNDKVAYESKAIHAAIEAFAPLKTPLHGEYKGEGPTRQLTVFGYVHGSDLRKEYQTPQLKDISPKNSPLWKTDVDQQLWYYATRGWARRWAPGVILGIFTPEEAEADYDGEPRKEPATVGAVTARLTAAAAKKHDAEAEEVQGADEAEATDAEFVDAATEKAEEAAATEAEPTKAEPEPAPTPEPAPQEAEKEPEPVEAAPAEEAPADPVWDSPKEAMAELERVVAYIKKADDVDAYLDGWRAMVKESFTASIAMDTTTQGDRLAQRRRLEIAKEEATAKPTRKRANA